MTYSATSVSLAQHSLAQLYDQDMNLWYMVTVARLRAGDLHSLDIEHLIEEIEGLANRDQLELKSRLKILLANLLTRVYIDSAHENHGWENTIDEQRNHLHDLLEQSPSLKGYFTEVFNQAWQSALKQVRKDYSKVQFPDEWQFDRAISAVLTEEFWT
ncbi:MAG: DUF29 domain-containing protein [Leptolyngbyaceae cyanobacterium RU_5_1]|nr:DUF29 domain-containing protein [Leptolyngbyaceae cyanobacterium RU_5_1]